MRIGKESTLRLLIVDDSVEDAETVVSTLRNGGLAVRPLRPRDADELDAMLGAQAIDLALVAYSAQGIALADVVQRVRASGKDLPVIVLLDDIDETSVAAALAADARVVALRGNPEHLLANLHGEWANLEARRSLRMLEAQLRETERRCETLIASSRDPIAYVHEGMHVRANEAYLEMFGFDSFEDVEGLSLLDLVTPDHVGNLKEVLKTLARGAAPPPRQALEARGIDGTVIPATLEFAAAAYEGEPCVQVVFRRIIAEADPGLTREVEDLRQRDLVTGLLNRPTFQRSLEDAVAEAARGEAQYGLLLLEADHHQRLLQEIGLDAADRLASAVAERLREALHEDATVARFGEHSFAVLQRGPYADTMALAERLRQAFATDLLNIGEWATAVGVSIGGVQVGERIASVGQVLARADASLRTAVELGGNQVQIFDPAASDRAEEERVQHWLGRVRDALAGDGFSLLFQPAISLRGDEGALYEALLRLDNNGEQATPASFLGIAEENGLMPEIDRWVVAHAIEKLAEARRAGRQPRLMVKVGSESFQDERLLQVIAQQLGAHDVPGELLWLQVPEARISTQLRVAGEFAARAARLGCRVGLEQFGTGVDSFRLLAHFRPAFVRIDRSLTQDLPTQPELQQKLGEITARANSENIATVVGFVEDASALNALFNANVDYVQGHFIAAPGAAMDFDFG